MRRFTGLLLALLLIPVLFVGLLPLNASPAAAEQAQNQAAAARQLDTYDKALLRHVPVLKFDSDEEFFPVRVQAITSNVGNQLQRANGATLAERASGRRGLTIGYLRGTNKVVYPNGDTILESDQLDERGSDPDDIEKDARQFQSSPKYRDRIYGRVVRNPNGGGAWLQYWFFYYYNDFPRVNSGDHEGDFEMIQVKVSADGEPLAAVYAQHNKSSKCGWNYVQRRGSRPVVFVARGSHASYFRSGLHGQDLDNDGERERPVRGLIRIGNNSPQWLNWPGYWGASKASLPVIESDSPRGPKYQGQKWRDPEAFYEDSELDRACD